MFVVLSKNIFFFLSFFSIKGPEWHAGATQLQYRNVLVLFSKTDRESWKPCWHCVAEVELKARLGDQDGWCGDSLATHSPPVLPGAQSAVPPCSLLPSVTGADTN